MTLYALDDIDDAIAATRALLWPIEWRRWLKLSFVMLFIGGASGTNPLQFGGNTSGAGDREFNVGSGMPDTVPAVVGSELAVIAAIGAFLLLLGLLFVLAGSIMEFVFVRSLQDEKVTLRRYWRTHWRQGLRLFGFRVGFGVLSLGVAGLLVGAVIAPGLLGFDAVSLGLLLVVIPVGIVLGILSRIVTGFTTVFVVPIMMVEQRGLISAWRQFWPTVTGQWKQYLVYVVMSVVLQIAGGILAGIVTVIAALVVAIPFGIVGLLGAGLLAVFEPAGWALLLVAGLLFVLALVVLSLSVSIPVQTFLRYYALLVLGDTNSAFDLIPERRQAIRE